MQFSAVLSIFIVKTQLNSFFTNDLKRQENFSKHVHNYRPSLFKKSFIVDYQAHGPLLQMLRINFFSIFQDINNGYHQVCFSGKIIVLLI